MKKVYLAISLFIGIYILAGFVPAIIVTIGMVLGFWLTVKVGDWIF